MLHRSYLVAKAAFCLPAILLFLIAAEPLSVEPDELVRRANAAFLRDDLAGAESGYAAAAERSADPGLVAFNQGTVFFQKGEFREAELHFTRVLRDRDCPPDRAAKAWFNRGTCLLRRGSTSAIYRSAIASFERCLALETTEATLRADARHNLELAKLLWAEANRKSDHRDNPNDAANEDPPASSPPPEKGSGSSEPNGNNSNSNSDRGSDQSNNTARDVAPKETSTQKQGNNSTLAVPKDDDPLHPLSPEDTREYLKRTADRLARERRAMLRTLYGPGQPGVRDW